MGITYTDLHLQTLTYAERALRYVEPESNGSRELVSWLVEHQQKLHIRFLSSLPINEPKKKTGQDQRADAEGAVFDESAKQGNKFSVLRKRRLEQTLSAVERSKAVIEATQRRPLRLFENIRVFAEKAKNKIDQTDIDLLLFYIAAQRNYGDRSYRSDDLLHGVLENIRYFDDDSYYVALAVLLNRETEVVKQKIAKLVSYGLIDISDSKYTRYGENPGCDVFKINKYFADKLFSHDTPDTFIQANIGEKVVPPVPLSLADYRSMGGCLTHLINTIKGAAGSQAKGKNFGMVGDPGTGKTTSLALIEEVTGIPVFLIGAAAKSNETSALEANLREATRTETISDLLRAVFFTDLLGTPAIIAIDEAGRILTTNTNDNSKTEGSANKSFLTAWLSNNDKVVALFLMNSEEERKLDAAIRRRLVPWTRYTQPATMDRARIMSGQVSKLGLEVPQLLIAQLAEEYPHLAPGVTWDIFQAIAWHNQAVPLTGEKICALISDQFQEQQFALTGNLHTTILQPKSLVVAHPALWSANTDLIRLQHELSTVRKGFVITAYGPYGAGKKTFAYDLAKSLGRRVLQKTGTDIYFGFSKHFPAFNDVVQEAVLDNSLLLLSSQNVLLDPGWDIDDQFYRAIEKAGIPVVLSADDPNPSPQIPDKLRSSSFDTIAFSCLTPAQAMMAYYYYFDQEPPSVMQTFTSSTLDIFATTKRNMQSTGLVYSSEQIVEMLHRRAGQHKSAGWVDVNTIIPHSPDPQGELIGVSFYPNNEKATNMFTKRIVPLTLSERYELLKKMPQILRWPDLSHQMNKLRPHTPNAHAISAEGYKFH